MKNKSVISIAAALLISIVLGVLLQNNQEVANMFQPLGDIYINLIKMIMVPLVFTSLVLGICNITDVKKIGKMGITSVVFFGTTTAIAVIIGICLSEIFKPGIGIETGNVIYEAKELPSFIEMIVGIFPSNIIEALLEANMLQIIFVAVIMGVGLVKIAPKGTYLKGCVEDIFELMITITKGVMALTPMGIIGLMTPTVAKNGIEILLPLGKLILVFYLGVVLQIGITYCFSIRFLTNVRIKDFFEGMMPAQIVAFVSCSSMAALPISLQRTQEKLKISREVSGFVLPLGATINMDGNALYQGLVALFIAQAYGIELSLSMQVIIVLTGTLASIGAAGVPGVAMVVLSTVLLAVGLPVDGIALVAGVDRVLDMGRTLINVTGDAVTACVVDKYVK